ncbi:MAG TPA: hypothetical protein VK985_13640 [Rariglobus sp.]|nr:hypothetical protein [Rariglobus sp.]
MALGGCKPSRESVSGVSVPQVSLPSTVTAYSGGTEEAWMVRQISQALVDLSGAGKAASPVDLRKLPDEGGETRYEVKTGDKVQVISITPGVWNPAGYAPLAKELFVKATTTEAADSDRECASALLSPSLKTFIAENQRISLFLSEHPASVSGHVQAALLLGTIALNDYSGEFRDVRSVLNRLTAHLAAADAQGGMSPNAGRQLAEVLRLTLCGQQAEALVALRNFPSAGDKTLQEWAALLILRNTCDWREGRERALAGSDALKHEYFRSLVRSVGPEMGLQFIKDAGGKPDAGYWRIANEVSLSVSNGHLFTKPALGVEVQESGAAAKAFGLEVAKNDFGWLKQYADTPEGSVLAGEAGKGGIQVAGKNLLAGYHQRHLMQAAQKTFEFLHDNWGVKDEATKLSAFIDGNLSGFRYAPFVRRMIARNDASRREENARCEVIIRDHPEMVTPALWISLRDDENGRRVLPFPDHHGWFRPEVPRGTAFEVGDRLYQIGVGDENDDAWMKQLWERTPYSYSLARYNAYHENGDSYDNMSPEIAGKWLGPLTGFNLRAMRLIATAYKGQPELYQPAMEKAAALDPDLYIELGEYLDGRGLREKAAQAFLQAYEKADDRVYMANQSLPLIKYLYEKGDVAKATKVAEDAAEVYSYSGLGAYIWLLERQGKWKQAIETARKVDDRYNQDKPVAEAACLVRLNEVDPSMAAANGHERKLSAVFPGGLKKVQVADFKSAPKKGVLIAGSSRQLVPFGLRPDMVIVALNGIRTDTFGQYCLVRELADDPQMSLIVWDGSHYRLSEGSLPGRKFGIDMVDYVK